MIICETLPLDKDTPGSVGELLGTDHSLDLISTVGSVVSIRVARVIGDRLVAALPFGTAAAGP